MTMPTAENISAGRSSMRHTSQIKHVIPFINTASRDWVTIIEMTQ